MSSHLTAAAPHPSAFFIFLSVPFHFFLHSPGFPQLISPSASFPIPIPSPVFPSQLLFPSPDPSVLAHPSPFSISVPFWIPLPFALSPYVSASLSPLLSLTFFHPPVFSPFLITCSQPHPLAASNTGLWCHSAPHFLSPTRLPSPSHSTWDPGVQPTCRQARGLQWGAEHWGKVFAQEEGVRGWGWGGQDLGSSRFLESYQDPASDPS